MISKEVPIPSNEKDRLKALVSLGVMNTLPEEKYDAITRLASHIGQSKVALISLLDEERQWFKSKVGVEIKESPRSQSFCQHTIMNDYPLVVKDTTLNDVFKDYPTVIGSAGVRFYAGFPLRTQQGLNIGALCVLDPEPKSLSADQKSALQDLAVQVITMMDSAKVEQVLFEEKKKLNNFFELNMDLTAIAGVDGYFRKINRKWTELLGYSEKELLGSPFTDFIHPHDIKTTLEEVEKVGAGAKTINFVNRFRTSDGDYRVLSWSAAPDQDGDNLYAIARDITEQKKVENDLKHSNEELDQFSYIVSHDLKAPLRAITTLIQFIQEDLQGKLDEVSEKNFNLVISRTNRMQHLITDILNYSKLGKKSVEKEKVDTLLLVKEIVSDLNKNPGLFKVKIDQDLPSIRTKKIFLQQVFSNIVSNAFKYNDKELGELAISYKVEDSLHCFCFKDNGPGIELSDQDKVFEVFYTIDGEKSEDSTGIGLATVKKLVRELEGTVEIESKMGEGTCFTVKILSQK